MMKSKDIIVKKNELWLSEPFLLSKCKELTESYLRFCRSSVKVKSWQFLKKNNTFYYEHASIPNRSPNYYQSQLPDVATLEKMARLQKSGASAEIEVLKKRIEDALNRDYAAYMPLYAEFHLQQKTLSQSAAILEAIARGIIEDGIPERHRLNYITACGRVLDDMGVKLYLPKNCRRLQDKIKVLLKDGDNVTDDAIKAGTNKVYITDVVYLPRRGNCNRVKYADKEVLAWMMVLRGSAMNITNALIIRKIQFLCLVHGKPVPSASWFDRQLALWENKQLTVHLRYGSGSLLRRYTGYIPKLRPVFAGDCWQVDGTRFNILAWREKDVVTGKFIEKYLYMVVVRDVYSGYVLGWSFGLHEDRWMYAQAVMMAYETAGHLASEIVFDRFPGHNTVEWKETNRRLEKMGVIISITSEATGKAELERWIGTLQTVFEMESLYYYGEGVRSRRDYAHRHPNYMTRLRSKAQKDGWNADAAIREAERVIEAYNSTKLSEYSTKYKAVTSSPCELYAESEKPHVIIPSTELMHLATKETKIIQIYGDQIDTKIGDEAYNYAVCSPDTWLKYPCVLLAFDRRDLSIVWLFDIKTEKYLGEAHLIELGQRYGKDRDYAPYQARKEQLKANKAIKAARFEELTAAAQGVNEELLLMAGRLPKGTSEAAESQFLTEISEQNYLIIASKEVKEIDIETTSPDDVDDEYLNLDNLVRGQY